MTVYKCKIIKCILRGTKLFLSSNHNRMIIFFYFFIFRWEFYLKSSFFCFFPHFHEEISTFLWILTFVNVDVLFLLIVRNVWNPLSKNRKCYIVNETLVFKLKKKTVFLLKPYVQNNTFFTLKFLEYVLSREVTRG